MQTSLDYGPDHDTTAEAYVREALRRSHRGNWRALLADDRVPQTYRVLKRIEATATRIHIHRREAITSAKADRDAGLISAEHYADDYRAFTHWRDRVAVFDTVLRHYLDMAADRMRTLHRDVVVESLRSTLLTLAVAIDEHRNTHSGEESLADTALWARLRLLPWPAATGTEPRTLAEAVAAERARRGPARHTSDGVIEFRGMPVFGETIDVADLLLAVTDHTRPSIPRPKLVELWKRQTPDLLNTAAAEATAAKHKGSHTSNRLRTALQFLEALGLITRTNHKTNPEVVVTDRANLAELRRRWDNKHFGDYDLDIQGHSPTRLTYASS